MPLLLFASGWISRTCGIKVGPESFQPREEKADLTLEKQHLAPGSGEGLREKWKRLALTHTIIQGTPSEREVQRTFLWHEFLTQ